MQGRYLDVVQDASRTRTRLGRFEFHSRTKNIKKNYIKKINIIIQWNIKNNKWFFSENSSQKINAIGQSDELTNLLNSNSNLGINKQLKDSSSFSNCKKNFNKFQ